MGATPIYLVTPAPMRAGGGRPVTKAEMLERASQEEYLRGVVQYAMGYNDMLSWDWADEMDEERREALQAEHSINNLAEAVQSAVSETYDKTDEPLPPLVALFAAEVLRNAIDALLKEHKPNPGTAAFVTQSWHGQLDWFTTPSPEGPGTEVFVTGGLSWGDQPTDCYDDLLLVDVSRIFYEPFPADQASTKPSRTESNNHNFIISVSGCAKEQAKQIVNERVLHSKDYGFPYVIRCREAD